jgi:hypothetical protein
VDGRRTERQLKITGAPTIRFEPAEASRIADQNPDRVEVIIETDTP